MFVRARWPSGRVPCPYCTGFAAPMLKGSSRYHCRRCERLFSIFAGTIFQGSQSPLRHWLTALGLATEGPISSAGLARHLGIKQGAAWRILRVLRAAVSTPPFQAAVMRTAPHPENLPAAEIAPAPSRVIYQASYQPKFHLPMSFEVAVEGVLAVGTAELRAALVHLAKTARGRLPRVEWLDGSDPNVDKKTAAGRGL